MGLDSFLEKLISIGAWYSRSKIKGNLSIIKDGKPISIDLKKIENIRVNVMHWSSAYHIHEWFINSARIHPKDKSQGFDVTREKVAELLDICKKIKGDHKKAKKLLPTDYDYDEYYFETIDNTIKSLEETLKDEDNEWYWYEYL